MTDRWTNREQVYFNADNCFTLNEPLGIKALTFTWMPSWWKRNYGIAMGKRYVLDPDYRVDASMRMERAVAARFPMMCIGNEHAQPAPIPPNWINATTAAAAGASVIYSDDNYPATMPLPPETLDKLAPPEHIEDIFPYDETIRQVAYMNARFGTDMRPHLFKNGFANDSIQLMGHQAMTEAMDDSPRFHHLLDYSMSMWKLALAYNFTKGSMPPIFMLLNCAAPLFGPDLYEKFFFHSDLEVIQALCDHGQRFMLHHCGHFDNFIPLYRQIPHADMIQIGHTSDPAKALEAFPEADVEYVVSPYEALRFSKEEMRKKTMRTLEAARGQEHRFSIVAADLEIGTPDENLVEIYRCCKEWASS